MSELYLMPVSSAKTNGSYIVPTSSRNSFASNRKTDMQDHSDRTEKKEHGFRKRLRSIFKRSDK